MYKGKRYVYLDQDVGVTSGTDTGASANSAGADAASPGSTDAATTGAGAATGNVLSAGQPAASAATPPAGSPPTDANAWIASKFQVNKEDGTLDVEASARKVAEAHGHLERRFGAGDVPPKTAEEYKINLPEALADKFKQDELAASDGMKDMLTKAHAAGLSQKQVDFVVGEFLDRSLKLQSGMQQLSAEDATTQLKEGWKTEAEFKTNVQAAFKAGQTYAGKDFDGILKDYGNDPRVVRMLANVGKELGEDTGVSVAAQGMSEPDVEALQKSPAYWNANDPAHAQTKAKVDNFYAAKFGTQAKRSGAMTFGAKA